MTFLWWNDVPGGRDGGSERGGGVLGDAGVLFAGSSTDTDRADDLAGRGDQAGAHGDPYGEHAPRQPHEAVVDLVRAVLAVRVNRAAPVTAPAR